MLSLTAKILILVFLSASMLAIGLQFNIPDFTVLFKQKRLLLKSFLANFMLVPLVGIVFIHVFELSQAVSFAIIALALTPGGLSAIQFASKIKRESTYVAVIILLLSLSAAFISPLLISFFLPNNIILIVPYANILIFFILFLFMPMLLGIISKIIIKKIHLLSRFFALIGTLSFLGMIAFTFGTRRMAISAHAIYVIGIMLLFIVLTMFIGWMMGGPKKSDRQALTIMTSMRNLAICLAIAMKTMPDARTITSMVSLGALMIFPNMLFTLFVTLRARKN